MTDLDPEHRARLIAWGKTTAADAPPLPAGALAALAPVRQAVADHLAAKDKT